MVTPLIPIEVQEASYPIEIESYALRLTPAALENSVAARPRTQVSHAGADAEFSTRRADRCPAWGLNGGGEGQPGAVISKGSTARPKAH